MILTASTVRGMWRAPDDEVIEAVAGDIADAHTSMTGHDRVTMSYEGWEHRRREEDAPSQAARRLYKRAFGDVTAPSASGPASSKRRSRSTASRRPDVPQLPTVEAWH